MIFLFLYLLRSKSHFQLNLISFLKFFQNKKTTINILQKWFLKNLDINDLNSSKNLDYKTFDSFNQIYIKKIIIPPKVNPIMPVSAKS